jgi:phosphosulfolactate synthase
MSRMLTDVLLKEKIRLYHDHKVEAFPGGQYLEYAETIGKTELYFPACVEAGYGWVEVSDNILPGSGAWKVKQIRTAVGAGLHVLGEVGKKEGLARDASFADDARACLDAGAEIILLEAAELVSDDPAVFREVERAVVAAGSDRVMFELPGPWIEGVNLYDVHRMRRHLIDRYGREVNLGNVAADDLFSLEAYRRGLGVNAGSEEP